jgi:hypothetical protein
MLVCSSLLSHATHNRAGEITYKKLGPLEYQFTLVMYTKIGPVTRDRATLSFGDGSVSDDVFFSEKSIIKGVFERRVYQFTHSFPSAGEYVISYKDENRNDSVINMTNSVGTPFYVETYLLIDPLIGFNTSPTLLLEPLDFGAVGQIFIHNPNPFDIDGDSLSFELVPCKQDVGTEVNNFFFPSVQNNLAKNSFAINPQNGELKWDFPLRQGLYNVAIKISEFRNGRLIGYIIRDMQIPISATKNNKPVIEAIKDTCIIAGANLSVLVKAHDEPVDPNSIHKVTLNATGGPFEVDPTAIFNQISQTEDVQQTFQWNTTCRVARGQPYMVVFKAEDNASNPLNDLFTWRITVMAPAPDLSISAINDNVVSLSWIYDSLCINKTLGYYIYRKKGSDTLTQALCERGMDPSWDYELIANIKDARTFSYVDQQSEGLDRGNQYCYRIVAYFPDKSESKVSNQACAAIYKDVPVILNATVTQTDISNGKIYVEWSKPPLGSDTVLLYTPPYEFRLFQSENTSPLNYQLLKSVTSNTFSGLVDTLHEATGLNTLEKQYIYKVEFWSNHGDKTQVFDTIGTSNPATSVYLTAIPKDNRVELSWTEKVPWLNTAYALYRIQNQTDTVLIKATNESSYIDTNLTNGIEYEYFVKSVGAYTLNLFKKPLINLSEIQKAIPVDNEPPCQPILRAVGDCNLFTDTLTWKFVNFAECKKEIVAYKVYRSFFVDEEPQLITTINNPNILNLTLENQKESIAGCFTIVAVDSIGLETSSNKVCIDNCPGIVLPNVFTPNGDGFNETALVFTVM